MLVEGTKPDAVKIYALWLLRLPSPADPLCKMQQACPSGMDLPRKIQNFVHLVAHGANRRLELAVLGLISP